MHSFTTFVHNRQGCLDDLLAGKVDFFPYPISYPYKHENFSQLFPIYSSNHKIYTPFKSTLQVTEKPSNIIIFSLNIYSFIGLFFAIWTLLVVSRKFVLRLKRKAKSNSITFKKVIRKFSKMLLSTCQVFVAQPVNPRITSKLMLSLMLTLSFVLITIYKCYFSTQRIEVRFPPAYESYKELTQDKRPFILTSTGHWYFKYTKFTPSDPEHYIQDAILHEPGYMIYTLKRELPKFAGSKSVIITQNPVLFITCFFELYKIYSTLHKLVPIFYQSRRDKKSRVSTQQLMFHKNFLKHRDGSLILKRLKSIFELQLIEGMKQMQFAEYEKKLVSNFVIDEPSNKKYFKKLFSDCKSSSFNPIREKFAPTSFLSMKYSLSLYVYTNFAALCVCITELFTSKLRKKRKRTKRKFRKNISDPGKYY